MSVAHGNPLGPVPQPASKGFGTDRGDGSATDSSGGDRKSRSPPAGGSFHHWSDCADRRRHLRRINTDVGVVRDTGVNWIFQGHDGAIQ